MVNKCTGYDVVKLLIIGDTGKYVIHKSSFLFFTTHYQFHPANQIELYFSYIDIFKFEIPSVSIN